MFGKMEKRRRSLASASTNLRKPRRPALTNQPCCPRESYPTCEESMALRPADHIVGRRPEHSLQGSGLSSPTTCKVFGHDRATTQCRHLHAGHTLTLDPG